MIVISKFRSLFMHMMTFLNCKNSPLRYIWVYWIFHVECDGLVWALPMIHVFSLRSLFWWNFTRHWEILFWCGWHSEGIRNGSSGYPYCVGKSGCHAIRSEEPCNRWYGTVVLKLHLFWIWQQLFVFSSGYWILAVSYSTHNAKILNTH